MIKFTIITASFNSEKTIQKTFDSILSQSYLAPFEYIVIDGASTDSTVEIIKQYEPKFKARNIHFKWLSEKDSGIYDAWNKGLKLSTGEWISFLGSDDCYLNDALETYLNAIKTVANNKTYDLISSNVNIVSNGKIIRKIRGKWNWTKFRRYMTIAHVGAFHNAKYFRTYGPFDDSYKIAGDYELLLRARQNLKAYKIDKLTAIMGAGGVSNTNVSKVFSETLRAKNQTAKVDKWTCHYDKNIAFIKYNIRKLLLS